MNNYFKKLNINFEVPPIYLGKNEVNYGLEIDNKFHGIWYDEITNLQDIDFKKFVNNKDCKVNLLQANSYIPPHTDSNMISVLNFYLAADNCLTQFYELKNNAIGSQIKNQTDGKIYTLDELTLGPSFMAFPGDVYLLNVSKVHSVIPLDDRSVKRAAVCLSFPDLNFNEMQKIIIEN